MPPRTRACATCRQKRIKCDGRTPVCIMCMRYNRKCPGPESGALIIEMSNTVRTRQSRTPGTRTPSVRAKRSSPSDVCVSAPASHVDAPAASDAHSHVALRSDPWADSLQPTSPLLTQQSAVPLPALPTSPVVLHAAIEAFYARFLGYFTTTGAQGGAYTPYRTTWMHRLPELSTRATTTSHALALALRATAAAYAGLEVRDAALVRFACDAYGVALRAHHVALGARRRSSADAGDVGPSGGQKKRSSAGGPSPAQPPDALMAATTVLLSLFEAMTRTSPNGYRAHIAGAARMLDMAADVDCRAHAEDDGGDDAGVVFLLRQLSAHVRAQLVFVCLATRAERDAEDDADAAVRGGSLVYVGSDARPPSSVASSGDDNSAVFPRLAALVATLAQMHATRRRKRELGEAHAAPPPARLAELAAALASLWTACYTERLEPPQWRRAAHGTDVACFRDGFTALTVSFFHAARILLAVLGQHHAHHPPANHLQSPFPYPDADAFAGVLVCALHLDSLWNGCAVLRVASPLYLVALHAPNAATRAQAARIFQQWEERGCMGGISKIAMDGVRSERREAEPSLPEGEAESLWID